MAKSGRKRVGRGPGSGAGKTAGRGTKGQLSRSGIKRRAFFEGGQMSLARRIPKRGFKNPSHKEYQVVNLGVLASKFEAGVTVTPQSLREKGLVRHPDRLIKILGGGEIGIALTVQADAFTASAREKLARAGGGAQPRQAAAQ
ncbi:MAG TPA: 50S ribosomal protein L15 [bacterium]|nr:50S ribosomal protein L15 [bacterium]